MLRSAYSYAVMILGTLAAGCTASDPTLGRLGRLWIGVAVGRVAVACAIRMVKSTVQERVEEM